MCRILDNLLRKYIQDAVKYFLKDHPKNAVKTSFILQRNQLIKHWDLDN